ncbi:GPI-anchored adhesin-like protein PGA55 [Asbolus verrucosus]|uniref:GPI-anchored adhesin-like protein PGA55 n=1 Tax=Asbolus verrucosus TaxID=1661398 RepID=A0A482WAL6_ASBVE|nr:GPI-anchored adhesin-like protein PGA55 [Asbolus verrucosus]
MDENNGARSPKEEELKVPESPKPLAFTVDFGDGKTVDTQRHKTLVEKFQKKHRRGQSLSKIDEPPLSLPPKKHPHTGNLPRKSSFQSEGYFSSDEKSDRIKNVRCSAKRSELSLPLRSVTSDKMTQSFPNSALFSIDTPEIELKDISSPELDMISPFSPKDKPQNKDLPKSNLLRQFSSPEYETKPNNDAEDVFIDGTEFDFDKSDTVSDAGTYTLDADNYSEEQKARMSIDTEFKIEQISVSKKTEEYIKNLNTYKQKSETDAVKTTQELNLNETSEVTVQSPKPSNKFMQQSTPNYKNFAHKANAKMLSPILSPTQNLSITQNDDGKQVNSDGDDLANKTFTKIMFPSPKARNGNGLGQLVDQGSVISVTSSGAFRSKSEKEKPNVRKLSLTKSEIQVEAYVGDKVEVNENVFHVAVTSNKNNLRKLTANIVNVQSISTKNNDINGTSDEKMVGGNLVVGKVSNLPPTVGSFSGKVSPTKIPSPIHTLSRPRSRNSISSLNVDLSDSSLETESYLKPTQNCINSLQQRLSLDSDQDSDYDNKYGLQLNNTPHNLLKQRATHIRHNSLDDKSMKISNKLEHFQSKNLQGIDQTYSNMFNQYNKVMHKIQNSPNNSPIRRSSSFSTKNQINIPAKNTNLVQQESNLRNSPSLTRSTSIQRSASTANIKPNFVQVRRSSGSSDHQKIDRNQFGDTESSSEEDFEKSLAKKKDLSNLTNTRYNRAFSLRRARLDEPAVPPKCPNTPEMRRKFQPEHIRTERAISMDRKPVKTNEVQSRYMLNVTKKAPVVGKVEPIKHVPKVASTTNKNASIKPQVFSRTDSGRFSMRTNKPPTTGAQKTAKKDGSGKKSSGRSNSSLSSREKEFQNWKRRKSYDPMKAAAEGKRKEMAKRQNIMTQSYTEANQNQDCDSSPSHSSSVHRSQSFHGTAALEQLISSEEEEDLTLSADEGFSPPTPSPCELSPARASLRNAWKDRVLH